MQVIHFKDLTGFGPAGRECALTTILNLSEFVPTSRPRGSE